MQPTQDAPSPTTNSLIHDVRNPLNRISMQAEMVKLVLENDMPKEKAIAALDKILVACQDSSAALQKLAEHSRSVAES
ncbi:histidine kinase [uncultured Paraglaciecola sp.]|uniref:histidine kinase n=1 Tax=uncultured Paraglaciecola sp. TaxID=1765024 RepID=UPI0030D72DED|tara:strand:- start:12626 stop:12859 length:234 start_codon:yes stop_codon:yes gene_type:complete